MLHGPQIIHQISEFNKNNNNMKKINFKELEIKSLSGKTLAVTDKREEIAEVIYQRTGGLRFKLLAEKIYKEDICEFTDQEWEIFAKLIAPDVEVFSSSVCDAVIQAIQEE